MEMLFEIVKNCFDLWSQCEEFVLPCGEKFFVLFVMGWCDNDGAIPFPNISSHDTSTIRRIPDGDLGILIENLWHGLRIMKTCWSKKEATQFSIVINTRMEFESIVPSLMILPKISNISAYFVSISTNKTADLKHGGIHEFEWGMRRQRLLQYAEEDRKCTMTVVDKAIVGWKSWKFSLMIPKDPCIDIFQCVLPHSQNVPNEDGDNLTLTQCGWSTAFELDRFLNEVIYQTINVGDMMQLQMAHMM